MAKKYNTIDFRHLDGDHEIVGDGMHLDVHQPRQPMCRRQDEMPRKRRPSKEAWRKVSRAARRHKDGLSDVES